MISELRDVAEFHEEFLRRDGIFALEMIKMNVGRFVTEHIMERLWTRYLELKKERKIMRTRIVDDLTTGSASTGGGSTPSGCETPPKKLPTPAEMYPGAALKQRPSAPYQSVIH